VHTTEGALYVVLLGRPQMPGQVQATHVVFDSSKWKTILAHEKERLLATSHGFWMLLSELRCTFTHIELAHLDAQISVDEPSLAGKRLWYMNVYQAGWRRGVTAGGCRNNTEFFHVNPQIQISLEEEDTVVICLNQFSIMEPKVIGFSLYTLSKPLNEMAPANFFKKQKSAINSQYTNSKQVSNRCKLDAGSYLLLPTTYEPRIEADFSLRVFSSKPLSMRVLDENPQLLRAAIVRAPAPTPGPHRDQPFAHYESLPQGGYWRRSAFVGRFNLVKTIQVAKSERNTAGLKRRLKMLKNLKTEQVFLQLADEHRTVDPFQLQELLDACLPNDYIKSCAQIDTCRHIVLTMGNGKGRLPMAQFRDLMCSLKLWQTVFRMHAREKMGVVRAERLRDALRDLGFVVPEHVLSNLVLRYMRKDGMLRFGDFVSAVLHLQRAFVAEVFFDGVAVNVYATSDLMML
ncbi:Calpain-C, partial [Eumeta japonica]